LPLFLLMEKVCKHMQCQLSIDTKKKTNHPRPIINTCYPPKNTPKY
jgi:hypothetical protein